MSRTKHLERDSRRTERAERHNLAQRAERQTAEREAREGRKAQRRAAELERAADRRVVRLSYSSDPQTVLFGPDAGKVARVGLDESGRFIIVPVDQIEAWAEMPEVEAR